MAQAARGETCTPEEAASWQTAEPPAAVSLYRLTPSASTTSIRPSPTSPRGPDGPSRSRSSRNSSTSFEKLAAFRGLGHRRPALTSLPLHFFPSEPYLIAYQRDTKRLIIHSVLHGGPRRSRHFVRASITDQGPHGWPDLNFGWTGGAGGPGLKLGRPIFAQSHRAKVGIRAKLEPLNRKALPQRRRPLRLQAHHPQRHHHLQSLLQRL
jgi:plasmid stabilization system protein ParE